MYASAANPSQIPYWPMGYPADQPYLEHQNHELYHPAYQHDYSSHDLAYPSHPYQTCFPETGDYCPTWSNEDLQIQNTPYYPDQTCPYRPHYQSYPQQCFKPNSEKDHHANSVEEEIEGVTALQQKVQGCTRSEAEMIMEIQHTYEEQQSNVGNMIRQVALLTVMIKEIQENRAKSEVGEEVTENGMTAAEGKSGSQLEKVGTGEIESYVEEVQTEEKSIITPSEDDEPQETLEEARNKPPEKDEEVIEQKERLDKTLSYLQTKRVSEPNEKGE